MELSDRVAVVRAGRLQQVATPRALYERPANAFVAGFVGDSNLLDAVVESAEATTTVVRTPGGARIRVADSAARAGDRVLVLLRPEAAALREASGGAGEGLAGVVEDVADSGALERARVRLDGGDRLTVTRRRRAEGPVLRRGIRLALSWLPEDVRLLAPET
jgi:ABC-type Fe3+/spermidine/putrescine transport system ATPase subunit